MGYIWKNLVLQYASCKRRVTGQSGGPCRGTKFHIIDGYVYQLIGKGGCIKNRLIIEKLLQSVTSEEHLDYKEL